MNLQEYTERLRKAGVAGATPWCAWCGGVDTGTRFACSCKESCGRGICPRSVEEFEMPATPVFE